MSGFCRTSPKIDDLWPQISRILPTGASHNDENQSKYAVASLTQTYVPITFHLGGHTRVSGKLLNNFGASAPILGIFSPNFTHFVL